MKKMSGIEENDTLNSERLLESKEPDAFQFYGLVNGTLLQRFSYYLFAQ